ncbi:hypothetical protein V1477_014821 [Vespula maculifrons]|uniref:Uncharacterized protein n=2 Tax=Vespula TaxID=7451 RepID=A0A834JI16_VESVU|nr:hypothetical protein HZH66_010250 [Vespula vulgaris]
MATRSHLSGLSGPKPFVLHSQSHCSTIALEYRRSTGTHGPAQYSSRATVPSFSLEEMSEAAALQRYLHESAKSRDTSKVFSRLLEELPFDLEDFNPQFVSRYRAPNSRVIFSLAERR